MRSTAGQLVKSGSGRLSSSRPPTRVVRGPSRGGNPQRALTPDLNTTTKATPFTVSRHMTSPRLPSIRSIGSRNMAESHIARKSQSRVIGGKKLTETGFMDRVATGKNDETNARRNYSDKINKEKYQLVERVKKFQQRVDMSHKKAEGYHALIRKYLVDARD